MLLAVNFIFIPQFSYWACAWGGVAGYGTAMLLSYFVGQRKNPINYPMGEIAIYVALTALLFFAMKALPETLPVWAQIVINTILIIFFVTYIIKKDLPLKSLPIIGKYFR